jgi:hypothetical protein
VPPTELVSRGALIAALPTWWARLRAKAKVIGTAMTSGHDQVITLSDDGKHITLTDADKFTETHQVVGRADPGTAGPSPTEPRA